MKIRILIDGAEYVFERERLTDHHYSSHCLVCPFCLRVWAQVQVDGGTCFWSITVSCERCPWHTHFKLGIPGSLLEQGIHQHVDIALLDYLPEPLLRREFALHMKAQGVPLERNGTPFLDPKAYPNIQSYLRALDYAARSGSVLGRLPCAGGKSFYGSSGK